MRHKILRAVALAALGLGLAGCVVYEPTPGYGPAYAYGPPVAYAPPVYGSVVIGGWGGGGWGGYHHWR